MGCPPTTTPRPPSPSSTVPRITSRPATNKPPTGQSARSIVTRRSPHTTSQWPDPTGIGWTTSATFNPSLIRHDGRLVVVYRASPSMESTASRIGMAVYDPAPGWTDSSRNPLIYPTRDNELTAARTRRSITRMDGTSSSTTPSFPSTLMTPVAVPHPTTPSRTSGATSTWRFPTTWSTGRRSDRSSHTRSRDCGARVLSSRVTRTAMLFGRR